MIHFHGRQYVTKARRARPKWKNVRTQARLESLGKQMSSAVGVSLTKGITTFKKSIDPQKIYDAWIGKDFTDVLETIKWSDLHDHIDDGFSKVGETMGKASLISLEALPPPIQDNLRFDTHNPRIRGFIASRTAENFKNLSEDSAQNIQASVTQSFDLALTPRQVANQVIGSIGLLPRHAAAVDKYEKGLLAGKMDPSRASELASQYADRLLDYRAMSIGRTEVRLATNRGQLAVWQQAADQDLIDRSTARKVWVVDGDPCEICEPMDGIAVPLESSWTLNTGDTVDVPTESHTHCECGMELEFGESQDKLEASTPDEGDEDDS